MAALLLLISVHSPPIIPLEISFSQKRGKKISKHTHTHTHTHIYIYIYTETTCKTEYTHHDYRILPTRLNHRLTALPLLLVGEPCEPANSAISNRLRDGLLPDHVSGIRYFGSGGVFALWIDTLDIYACMYIINMEQEPEKIPFPFDMTGFRRTPNTYPPSRMSDVNRLPIIISWYEGKWHLI